MKPSLKISNANQAVANIAYRTNEVFPIYPITPASEMSELVEKWSANQKPNIFGNIPSTFEMQSEAGVAGAMHGSLQTGSLSSTFTSSQGLLLMLPNMYKIAGELSPNVIHVATRSIATHALSIFGDHSDIMAVRQSGYALLGSASVQEAQDFALIAQASTLSSRIPFVHFFDGFRTSHELNTINDISNDTIKSMLNQTHIDKHRGNSLDPNRPIIRGTAQGPDTFFQGREASNLIYESCPDKVQEQMDQFAKLTGRSYKIFDYIGHPQCKHLIISMASSTETIEETILELNAQGAQYGLIKVRLFRPFSSKHLIKALPKSVQSIAVLDRTKEPGSAGEPLYLDIVQSLTNAYQNNQLSTLPKIVGGRYGLSSKDFSPSMVNTIFDNLKQPIPKNGFTIGIDDDLTKLSLDSNKSIDTITSSFQSIFYDDKLDSAEVNSVKTLGFLHKNLNNHVQGYIERDYNKSYSRSIAHLRFNDQSIKAPYLIQKADFIACQNLNFLSNDNVLEKIRQKGTVLINSILSPQELWNAISLNQQKQIRNKEVELFIVDLKESTNNLNPKSLSPQGLYACFLNMLNFRDTQLNPSFKIQKIETKKLKKSTNQEIANDDFSNSLLGLLLTKKNNNIPVSLLPIDGTFETNTSWRIPKLSHQLASWDSDLCTQCGACSMACPQAAIEMNVFDDTHLKGAPKSFKSTKAIDTDWKIDLLNLTLQVHPDQCTACNNCVDACPSKAISLKNKSEIIIEAKENWNYAKKIPQIDPRRLDITKLNQQQLQKSYFKYPNGVQGCGESPYLKLVSQLFGDRMLIANATGASSIVGGALPTTPWSKNKEGLGPAWSNSLFEDNAEFGLGYRLSLDQQENQAILLLQKLAPILNQDLVFGILNATQNSTSQILEQQSRIKDLKKQLSKINLQDAIKLIKIANSLAKKSVWIIGGDGWAYDIGYGGLDHVLASGKNVNILVLDNEIYDNTGGQTSKATPFGAKAKFSTNGKGGHKKDLGLIAMQYDDVYVASVSMGADQEHCLKAIQEAENYDGPSIILAYSHSQSHGIDMKNPRQYHQAAVAAGQWLLYRRDPRRNDKSLNPFQFDSPKPYLPIQNYLSKEGRFKHLIDAKSPFRNQTIEYIQQTIDTRYSKYAALSREYKPNLHWQD